MTGKMRDYVKGLILGLSGKPLPMSQKEPVAYLYNGVRLPKLPERDEKAFPYALITYNSSAGGFYSLYCFSVEPAVASEGNFTLVPYDANNNGQYINTVFGEGKANSFKDPLDFVTLMGSVTEGTTWTNFDLRYKGTDKVYSAASDPVPVYE